MNILRTAAFAAALAVMGSVAQADQSHQHGTPVAAGGAVAKGEKAGMAEMMEKMASAKTPEERQALMAEHKKSKHGEGSGAGGHNNHDMHGGMMKDMMAKHQAMEKRMDMIEAMMKLMAERLPAPAIK